MKENKIKVLMVEPGKNPTETVLENNLSALQRAVSIGASHKGLIEVVYLDSEVLILCNEEAKLIGLEGNRRVNGEIIAGVFYVVGGSSDGEFVSLTDKQFERYKARFWEPESYTQEEVEQSACGGFFIFDP